MKHIIFIFLLTLLVMPSSLAQTVSAQSGPWHLASTWVGSVVPDSGKNITIGASHVVTIENDKAACRNVAFADTSSQLDMTAASSVLKVYGDFTLAGLTHKAFKSWVSGARIIFTGYAVKQVLSGWNTAGSSTTLMEMIVDKDTGKVSTARQNMRLSFGTLLEIRKGIFELDSTDDLESRTIGGTGTDGNILIGPKGIFTMVGGSSHIRKGTFTDTISSRLGKMTVYGRATFTSTSTNRININGIDIMEGGLVNLTTGGSSGYFNPNVISVKEGGILQNSTTTAIYHSSAYIVLESGGEFNSATSTTPLPVNGINYSNGTVRFSRSSDQTLPASLTTFNNMYLSGGGIKTLSSNITVNGTLSLRGTASLSLGAFTLTYSPEAILQYGAPGQTTPQTTTDIEFPAQNGPKNLSIYNTGGVTLHANRTVAGNLTLSSGVFDNNGTADDKVLTLASGATIRRASGTLSAAPAFAGLINLAYISTVSSLVTALEVPESQSAVQNITISSTQGVELGKNVTVNGILKFERGSANLKTAAFAVTLGADGTAVEDTATGYVLGKLNVSRTLLSAGNDFGGSGFIVSAGSEQPGLVQVSRISGPEAVASVNGRPSIARKWVVTAGTLSGTGRDITLRWPSQDDNGKLFGGLVKASVMMLNGGNWSRIGVPAPVHQSDPRTITVRSNVLGATFTITDTSVTNSVSRDGFGGAGSFHLAQNYPNPFNPATTLHVALGKESSATIRVFDISGNMVATLFNGRMNAGEHVFEFNAKALASGTYFAVFSTHGASKIVKMTLVK